MLYRAVAFMLLLPAASMALSAARPIAMAPSAAAPSSRMAALAASAGPRGRWMAPIRAALGGAAKLATAASGARLAASNAGPWLSTKAPYEWRVPTPGAPSVHELPDPPGMEPVFLYVLSRHGSRWPTSQRAAQIAGLAPLLQMVDHRLHPWAANGSLPLESWVAGELHPRGEDEMAGLARRLRRRFPGLLEKPYFPRRFPIISTQVARAAQSASAFSLGLFERPPVTSSSHSAAADRHRWPQPVAMSMAPKKRDPVLRFFDMCPAYLAHEDEVERWLAPWLWSHWEEMAPSVERRLGLPRGAMEPCDVDALYTLCGYEALSGVQGGACTAFSTEELQLLEWMEDVRLYETQGPGAAINMDIAGVLLGELGASLRAAAAASTAGKEPVQLARMMFAHCETLTPLLSLMGLFQGEEQPLQAAAASKAGMQHGAPEAAVSEAAVRRARRDLKGVDSLVDDAQLAVARRMAGGDGSDDGSSSSSMSEGSSSLSSSSGVFGRSDSASSLTSSSGSLTSSGDSSSSNSGKSHKHGPRAAGCVYKGRTLEGPPLQPPPGWAPRQRVGSPGDDARQWRGGRVAPLGANLVVALYRDTKRPGRHTVRFVHNEQVLTPPPWFCSSNKVSSSNGSGSNGSSSGLSSPYDCDLDDFLDGVVAGRAQSAAELLRICGLEGVGSSAEQLLTTADGLPLEL